MFQARYWSILFSKSQNNYYATVNRTINDKSNLQMAGSVIGKGGSNIQKLRQEYSAQVRIPDCPGPERVMNIQAGTEEMVVGIIQMAIPFMYEQGEQDDGGDRELRLLIHQSIVGGIIGKSGSKIKEIRENTGAHIKVSDSYRKYPLVKQIPLGVL